MIQRLDLAGCGGGAGARAGRNGLRMGGEGQSRTHAVDLHLSI